ncbi:MAG: hypothetical protein U0996_23715 [Planctomycetaceae bacterium]
MNNSASADPHGHGAASSAHSSEHHQSFWLWVLCLTGVDYFSTLAYQPSIAITNAGRLAPLATILLVLVTLFGAVPIYCRVAQSSPHGQGSISMLQRLMRGWSGKFLVLTLLGFAATDFVITITLSAADAAKHLIENPLFKHVPHWLHSQMGITLFMIMLLGAMFMKGFREVLGVAVAIVVVYLALNLVVISGGLVTMAKEPAIVSDWWEKLKAGDIGAHPHHAEEASEPAEEASDAEAVKSNAAEAEGSDPKSKDAEAVAEKPAAAPVPLTFWAALMMSILLFPKLALGLSGFETGVAVMPQIIGDSTDTEQNPAGRIKRTQWLLITSALIMSVMLIGSSLVVTTLIAPEAAAPGGPAFERSLAYLAHAEGGRKLWPFFGDVFGTIYDMSTISILCFAGASAMSGLLNLVPRYLPRFGMAPDWVAATRPLVAVIIVVCLIVTLIFRASVEAQSAAYATGVMVLILSACVAVSIERYGEKTGHWAKRMPWATLFITFVFTYTALDIMIEKSEGLIISLAFILAIMVVSLISRIVRSDELRTVRFQFANADSKFRWNTLQHVEIPVLAPHRPGGRTLDEKEQELRAWHHLTDDIPVVFVEVKLGDTSEFLQEPMLDIAHEGGRYIIRVSHCTSIAPTIAALAIALNGATRPIELHFGWSDESPLKTNLGFVLFGEGNVPFLVRELVRDAIPDEAMRPRVIIG